jgi:hypothetical protein
MIVECRHLQWWPDPRRIGAPAVDQFHHFRDLRVGMGSHVVTCNLERDASSIQQNLPFEMAKVVAVLHLPGQDGPPFNVLQRSGQFDSFRERTPVDHARRLGSVLSLSKRHCNVSLAAMGRNRSICPKPLAMHRAD